MKGSNVSVGMGCICFGLMLTVSMAGITQPYFSWISMKKLVSLISPETFDSPELYILTFMGNGAGVGKIPVVVASLLNSNGVHGTLNVTSTVVKRSVKRGGVNYFEEPITKTDAVSTNLHGKNYFRGKGESGLERLCRYKRYAEKQTKEPEGAKADRKRIEAEAEHRRMESTAKRKEARDEKVKNIKNRRAHLKNTHVAWKGSPNAKKSGGKGKKPENSRVMKQNGTIRKNGSPNLSNGLLKKNNHKSSPQKLKLKSKSKKKERTCAKSKCKTEVVVNEQKVSKIHSKKQKMFATKEWRKSHPGQGAQGHYSSEYDEHRSFETKKHGKKQLHKDGREKSDQREGQTMKEESDENETRKKKKSDKKGSVTRKNKIERSKKVSRNELEESDEETSSEDDSANKQEKNTKSSRGAVKSKTKEIDGDEASISSTDTSSKTEGGKKSAKKVKTRTKKPAQNEAKDSANAATSPTNKRTDNKKEDTEENQKASDLMQKQGNNEVYVSPILGLGLSSRRRAHSKAQAWSQNAFRRPMTGGFASVGRLNRASSNLYSAHASAGIWR